MANRSVVSIGVAASIGPHLAAQLAPLVEAAGFYALWVNDTPDADALEVLQAAAQSTTRLGLATGILPMDRRSPAQVINEVRARHVPPERLTLGIGSGQARTGALALMEESAAELRTARLGRVVIGALGPKMRRVAVQESDGVLLSWLTPAHAAAQATEARAFAPDTHVALYVRTALDADASERLHEEMDRYASFPAYAANFARQQASAAQTVLEATGAADAAYAALRVTLDAYRSRVDEVVLRAITAADTVDEYRRFLDDALALL